MAEGLEPLKTDEDVEEILRMAVRCSGIDGSTLRDRMRSTAEELGISEAALAEAEQQWAAKRRGEIDLENEARDRKLFRKMRVGDFLQHFGGYLAVNGFLAWIDWNGDHRLTWVWWVVFGWGIGMFTHAVALLGHGHDDEKKFQKWRRRRYRKED